MDAQTDQPAASAAKPLTHAETRLIILGVLLPTFMGSLDQTILATALPTIGRDFGDMHNLPWLITAYLIASTAATPLYGKIADIRGRRFTLRVALSMYMLGSLVCALSPNMLVLILGRVLHGLGGGGLTSIGMVVLGDIAAPKDRGRYYAYFSLTYTTAGATGPLLGGLVADHLHWSVIFWCNIPMAALALIATAVCLRRMPRFDRPHRLDVLGAVLIVLSSASFMLMLNQGGVNFAWTSLPILTLAGFAVVGGALFVRRLLTAPEPLIPIAILANPEARLGIAFNAFGWGAIIGLNIFLPIFLQSVMALSPTDAGLSLMVLMMALNLSAGLSGQLLGRVRHYKVVPTLALVVAIGAVVTLGWRAASLTPWSFEVLVALLGLGFGPLPPLSSVVVQNSVAMHQFGTAVGTMNFTRNLFATFLVAMFGAMVLVGGSPAAGHGNAVYTAAGFSLVFYAAATSLSIALISLLILKEKPLHTNLPPGKR